jgi:hypothetical protein
MLTRAVPQIILPMALCKYLSRKQCHWSLTTFCGGILEARVLLSLRYFLEAKSHPGHWSLHRASDRAKTFQ